MILNKVKYSVIIPTYNRADFLNELLECLVNQTFKEFEVLVCDDGSSDHTKEIVDQFTDRLKIRYFYEPNWGGPARPRNIGVINAIGDWLCFVDSDDLWEETKLYEVSKVTNSNVDVIYHLFKIKDSEQIIGNYHKSFFFNNLESLLFNGNKIVNSSLCIRKSSIEIISGFTEDKRFIAVEDFDLLIRLAKNNAKFHFIKKVLGTYRLNDTNISKDFIIQIRKFESLLKYHIQQLNYVSNLKSIAVIDYMKGSYLLTLHRNKIAKKFLINSLLHGSFTIKLKSIFRLLKCVYGK